MLRCAISDARHQTPEWWPMGVPFASPSVGFAGKDPFRIVCIFIGLSPASVLKQNHGFMAACVWRTDHLQARSITWHFLRLQRKLSQWQSSTTTTGPLALLVILRNFCLYLLILTQVTHSSETLMFAEIVRCDVTIHFGESTFYRTSIILCLSGSAFNFTCIVRRTRMPAAPVPGVRQVSRMEQHFRVIHQTSASGFLCGYVTRFDWYFLDFTQVTLQHFQWLYLLI